MISLFIFYAFVLITYNIEKLGKTKFFDIILVIRI